MTSHTLNRPFLTVASILAVTALSATSAYAGAAKDAKKLLSKSAKTAIENLQDQLKVREKVLSSSVLQLVTAKGKQGVATTTDAYNVWVALEAHQVDVRDYYFEAFNEMGAGFYASLGLLQTGGILAPDYPRGFRYGEEGPLRDFRFDADQALAKHYQKLSKKLDKVSQALAQSGIALCVNILPPCRARERTPSANSSGSYSTHPGLTIDLLLSYGLLATTGDSAVRITGSALQGADLTLTRLEPNGFVNFVDQAYSTPNRWIYTFSNVFETNVSYRISSEDGGSAEHAGLGIR